MWLLFSLGSRQQGYQLRKSTRGGLGLEQREGGLRERGMNLDRVIGLQGPVQVLRVNQAPCTHRNSHPQSSTCSSITASQPGVIANANRKHLLTARFVPGPFWVVPHSVLTAMLSDKHLLLPCPLCGLDWDVKYIAQCPAVHK